MLDTSAEVPSQTTESDGTYVGWLRGRYNKRREGSHGHQWGGATLGILLMPLAHRDLPTPGTSQGCDSSPAPVLSTMP